MCKQFHNNQNSSGDEKGGLNYLEVKSAWVLGLGNVLPSSLLEERVELYKNQREVRNSWM